MSKWVEKAILMDGDAIRRSLIRVAHEIVEKNKGGADLVLVGIRTRGVPLAERLAAEIRRIEATPISFGVLDITLYRDDLSRLDYQPVVRETKLPGNINGKNVILVDDVLYTGSSLLRVIEWLNAKSPRAIHTAVLADRHVTQLPIRADIVGVHLQVAPGDVVECHVQPYEPLFQIELLRLDDAV